MKRKKEELKTNMQAWQMMAVSPVTPHYILTSLVQKQKIKWIPPVRGVTPTLGLHPYRHVVRGVVDMTGCDACFAVAGLPSPLTLPLPSSVSPCTFSTASLGSAILVRAVWFCSELLSVIVVGAVLAMLNAVLDR
jgi:hypothetical protein